MPSANLPKFIQKSEIACCLLQSEIDLQVSGKKKSGKWKVTAQYPLLFT